MSISFVSQNVDYQQREVKSYQSWINRIIVEEGKKLGKIDYIFASQDQIVQINTEYLNHRYPTDIITFDNSYLETVSGDIYICLDVVKENSIEHSRDNFEDELNRVIVHGLLHLLGYLDGSEDEKSVIRNKENLYLEYLD